MKFSRIQYYFFLLSIFLLPFIIYKLVWLSSSKTAMGKVIFIGKTRMPRYGDHSYPLVEFSTNDYIVRFSGSYNLPFKEGDDFPVRYNTRNYIDARLNTFWGCWIETVIFCTIFFMAITIIFLSKGIIPKNKIIQLSLKGIEYIDK